MGAEVRSFGLLVSVQLRALVAGLGLTKGTGDKRARRRLALLVVGVALVVIVAVAYLFAMGAGLALLGAGRLVPALAVTFGSFAGVVFTFIKANGTLFGYRDYDLTMSLPVPTYVVVLARAASLFAMATLWAALFMVPLYAAYFWFGGVAALTPFALVAAVVSVLLAPLAPTSVAVFLAFALTAVASRFRRSGVAYLVLGIVAFAVFFFGSMAVSFSTGSMSDEQFMAAAADLVAFLEPLLLAYPLAAWASQAVMGGSVAALALFALVSLGAVAVCVAVVSCFYMAINAALVGRGASRAVSASALAERPASPLAALVKKELSCLVNTPVYAFNTLVGDLLMLVACGALAVMGMDAAMGAIRVNGETLTREQVSQVMGFAQVALPWVLAFFGVCGPSAACSFSLEGHAAWLMATAPVSARVVLGSKLLANFVHMGATTVVSLALLLASGKVAPLMALEGALLVAGCLAFFSTLGLAVDVSRPNFGWAAPQEVVKRGMPMMVAILGGMVAVFAGGAGSVALAAMVSDAAAHAFNLVVSVVLLAGAAAVFLRTARKPLYV